MSWLRRLWEKYISAEENCTNIEEILSDDVIIGKWFGESIPYPFEGYVTD